MKDEFLTEKDLEQLGFELNEEDDSWHRDGYAVSVNEKTNECLFFIEADGWESLIEIKEFMLRSELNELWMAIKGEKLF